MKLFESTYKKDYVHYERVFDTDTDTSISRKISLPSEWYEGFPMVILEALASGTPVLASKIGSLDEIIIEGETGYKFTPGDTDDLANKVKLHMLNNNHEALRFNARKQYEDHYSPKQNISQLLDIYNQVLKV